MAKLYELANDLEVAYELLNETTDLETGEVNEEAVKLINECNINFNDKISGLVEFIKRLTADMDAYKNEEERLYKLRKSNEKKVEWLKSYIKDNLIKTCREKVETISCKVSLGTSHSVNVLNLDAVPEQYKVVEQTIKADKKALAEAFKNGEEVAGAEYVENTTLRIK